MGKMTTYAVKIKHNGKLHDVMLDPSQPARAFKESVYAVTGVPVDRQKVMVKGGMLKDGTDMASLSPKNGQTFMVLGTAGPLPEAPKEKVTFLEDMSDKDLALAQKQKVGLINLGNTCYLNSTLQVLRAVPELQTALQQYSGRLGSSNGEANLTAALRDLYKSMTESSEPFPPLAFLSLLRQVAPQFAERVPAAQGGGYAQQDAQEAWVRIVNALGASLPPLSASGQAEGAALPEHNFVSEYMSGQMTITRSCPEAPSEPASETHESFSILPCNITVKTNEMTQGMIDGLSEEIEKHSPTLQRTALYAEERRVARLPAYLACHFVRFYWRRDVERKTKIMRKVRFPLELDTFELMTEDLKKKTRPAADKVREVEKARDDRRKVRARAKERKAQRDLELRTWNEAVDGPRPPEQPEQERMAGAAEGDLLTPEEEKALRAKEHAEVLGSIDPTLAADTGANPTGIYELIGIITHKGPMADGGHYMSWVKRSAADRDVGVSTSLSNDKSEDLDKDKRKTDEWYHFNDDKVTIIPQDKIGQLDGGGEDSVAYILLYRTKTLN